MIIQDTEGQEYEFPDDMPPEQAWELINEHLSMTESKNTQPPAQNNEPKQGETIYEVNRQRYALPSDWSDEQAWEAIQADQRNVQSYSGRPSADNGSIDRDRLVQNQDWLSASTSLGYHSHSEVDILLRTGIRIAGYPCPG
jgi:hypothetical protein